MRRSYTKAFERKRYETGHPRGDNTAVRSLTTTVTFRELTNQLTIKTLDAGIDLAKDWDYSLAFSVDDWSIFQTLREKVARSNEGGGVESVQISVDEGHAYSNENSLPDDAFQEIHSVEITISEKMVVFRGISNQHIITGGVIPYCTEERDGEPLDSNNRQQLIDFLDRVSVDLQNGDGSTASSSSDSSRSAESGSDAGPIERTNEKEWDVFICHASDDKDDFVDQLADQLNANGLEVWYDDWEIKPGASLQQSIDDGIARSQRGIVVLSSNFLQTEWAKREFRGLNVRNINEEEDIIIPVWLNIEAQQVSEFSPPLADLRALTAQGETDVEEVADEITQTVEGEWGEKRIGPAGKRPYVAVEDSHIYPGGEFDFTLSNIGDAPAQNIEGRIRVKNTEEIIGSTRAIRHGSEYNGFTGLGDFLKPGEENVVFKFAIPDVTVPPDFGNQVENVVVELCYGYEFEDIIDKTEPLWQAEISFDGSLDVNSFNWSPVE